MRSGIPDKLPYLLPRMFTPHTTKNPSLLRNWSEGTEAPPVERGDTITTHRNKCKLKQPRETALTPIAYTGPPLIAIEIATATETGRGTVIAIEGRIRLVAVGDTIGPTHTTNVDIPLPHVVTLEIRTNTDPVATAKAHASENALRDTETTNTAADLPLNDIDRPAGSTTAMTMKIRKSVGDVDARGGNAKRIRIVRGRNTTIPERNRLTIGKKVTEVMVETTTTPQIHMKASTDLGMTPTRCPFRIIL